MSVQSTQNSSNDSETTYDRNGHHITLRENEYGLLRWECVDCGYSNSRSDQYERYPRSCE